MTYYDIGIRWTNNLKRQRPIRLAGDRMALFAFAVIVAALLPQMIRLPIIDSNAGMVYAGCAIMILSLQAVRGSSDLEAPDHRRELVWLVIACMAYHLDLYRWSSLVSEALSSSSYVSGFSESLPWFGLLFVSLGCGTAVSIRVRLDRQEARRNADELRIKNRKLEQLQRHLERMVELRTEDLEKVSQSLTGAFREKAEVLAEISVQEERSRIAHEIHDVVGHTLTAAIVQLEVTKRIAEQQDRVPWDKLELLSGLVQKGLDDIRRAVKLISSDEVETMTLKTALRELIQYAEDTMEIAIEADISISSELEMELGKLVKQVLYHALQEGLTNSIRHGKCAHAYFSLQSSNGILRFRLVSDGEPYGSAIPGFGLSSMIERVKLLGGVVVIQSSADADGNPIGCELSIELPLVG